MTWLGILDINKKTILAADRNVFQGLMNAYEGGRLVDLSSILKYELLRVPVALA